MPKPKARAWECYAMRSREHAGATPPAGFGMPPNTQNGVPLAARPPVWSRRRHWYPDRMRKIGPQLAMFRDR